MCAAAAKRAHLAVDRSIATSRQIYSSHGLWTSQLFVLPRMKMNTCHLFLFLAPAFSIQYKERPDQRNCLNVTWHNHLKIVLIAKGGVSMSLWSMKTHIIHFHFTALIFTKIQWLMCTAINITVLGNSISTHSTSPAPHPLCVKYWMPTGNLLRLLELP